MVSVFAKADTLHEVLVMVGVKFTIPAFDAPVDICSSCKTSLLKALVGLRERTAAEAAGHELAASRVVARSGAEAMRAFAETFAVWWEQAGSAYYGDTGLAGLYVDACALLGRPSAAQEAES